MQEKYYMGRFELFFVILNITAFKVITGYTRVFFEISGPAAFIAAVVVGAVVFLADLLLLWLFKKVPGRSFAEIFKYAFGNFWGKAALSFFVIYFIITAAVLLRYSAEFVIAVSFPSAPVSFAAMFIIIGAVICAAQGFDAISRTHAVVVPIFFTVIVILMIMSSPKTEISNLSPYFGYGAEETFVKSFKGVGLYGSIATVFMLSSFVKSKKSFKKIAVSSVGTGVIIILAIVFFFAAENDFSLAAETENPVFQMVKTVSAGQFFRRMDGYFMYIGAASAILTVSLHIFFSSYIIALSERTEKIRPFNYSIGFIVLFLALLPKSFRSLYNLEKAVAPWVCLIIGIILAAAFCIAAKKTKVSGRKI